MPSNSAVGDDTMHELQIPPGLIDPVHSPAAAPAVHLQQPRAARALATSPLWPHTTSPEKPETIGLSHHIGGFAYLR
ncbi:hypothetical protein ACFU9B_42815 [Streptomyces sp. NPDC057592]|uniref:hypothetical protein n=1 Tax=unclassified Streptomyces TaxID=2593676 RepID=UPI0036A451B3